MSDFTMPSLGADMTEGTLLEWRVAPGDTVRRGDIVAVVDTSKAEIEVEIFQDGVIGELLVPVGTKVPVGTPLATVVTGAAAAARTLAREPAQAAAAPPTAAPPATAPPAAAPPAAAAPATAPPAAAAPAQAAAAPAPPPAAAPAPPAAAPPPVEPALPPSPAPERLRVSPLARRMAAALGVDLATVPGTGPGGAVTQADVERVAGATSPAPAPAAPVPPPAASVATPAASPPAATPAPASPPAPDRQAAMRRAIGELMARSKREVPHYYLERTIDLSTALRWLAERNADVAPEQRLIPAALLYAATARAVRATPELNGFMVDGELRRAEHVHLGVALALRGGGLIAPAIHDADRLPLPELMAALRDLAARARAGVLRGSEMADPTITVTNLGDRGADKVFGVIYPPQVALVGFGAIHERPWSIAGMLGVRPLVAATLSGDHRASDGADGSRLLAEIDRLLQAPEEL